MGLFRKQTQYITEDYGDYYEAVDEVSPGIVEVEVPIVFDEPATDAYEAPVEASFESVIEPVVAPVVLEQPKPARQRPMIVDVVAPWEVQSTEVPRPAFKQNQQVFSEADRSGSPRVAMMPVGTALSF